MGMSFELIKNTKKTLMDHIFILLTFDKITKSQRPKIGWEYFVPDSSFAFYYLKFLHETLIIDKVGNNVHTRPK